MTTTLLQDIQASQTAGTLALAAVELLRFDQGATLGQLSNEISMAAEELQRLIDTYGRDAELSKPAEE